MGSALGGAPESAQRLARLGVLQGVLPRALFLLTPHVEHSREHSLGTLAHRNRSNFCDLRLRRPSRTPEIARFPKQEKAMLHCDLRVRWKVASDSRFQAAISEPKTPPLCGISGDLAPSNRKSLAIAIVRFWCAKLGTPNFPEHYREHPPGAPGALPRSLPETSHLAPL